MPEKGAYWVSDGPTNEQPTGQPAKQPPDCFDLRLEWNKARGDLIRAEMESGGSSGDNLKEAQASADRAAGSTRDDAEAYRARAGARLREAQQRVADHDKELSDAKAAEAAARQALEACEKAAAGGGG